MFTNKWVVLWLVGLLYVALPQQLKAQAVNDTITVTHADTTALVPGSGTLGQRFVYDLGSIYRGALFTLSGPARWQKDDFIKAGAFVGASGLLLLADEDVARYFSKQGDKVPFGWHKAGWYMGKPQYNYGFTAVVYATGLISKNEKIRRTGVLIISAATAGGLLQTVLKTAAGRARPGAEEGNMKFVPFSKEEKYHSFPSGHTILSTTVFYAVAKQFSNPWAKAGILSVGLLTPVSRMWDDAHWISDVAIGAGLSIVCVEAVDTYLKKKERYEADRLAGIPVPPKKISWNLRAGYNQIGIVGVF